LRVAGDAIDGRVQLGEAEVHVCSF
jgi:hypothetical protein